MTAEVMLFTFPWQTSVSNLYLLCLSLPHHLFFSQPSFSPVRHAQLHNSRRGATSDQTKEETKMRRFFFFFQTGDKYLTRSSPRLSPVPLDFINNIMSHQWEVSVHSLTHAKNQAEAFEECRCTVTTEQTPKFILRSCLHGFKGKSM